MPGKLDIHIETYISGVDVGFYVFLVWEKDGEYCRQRILKSSSSEGSGVGQFLRMDIRGCKWLEKGKKYE